MLIECSNIKKSFQGIDLLKDISFKVDDYLKMFLLNLQKVTVMELLVPMVLVKQRF